VAASLDITRPPNRTSQWPLTVLGHASIAVTKDVYGHLLEGDKRAAAESMSRALFGG
jgi:hypothetical protein